MKIRPFEIHVEDTALASLKARLSSTRWPQRSPAPAWEDGSDLSFMRRLVDHWRDGFDWREQERRLNSLPQFMATVDDHDIHFVHVRGRGPDPLPLVLTHGWPGSFVEFENIIPMLTDPASFGADAKDAFDVVTPSLPGYGFSAAPDSTGVNPRRIAQLWTALMRGLGYRRFGLQGGDIGAGVSVWAGRLFPESVIGVHLNYIPGGYRPPLSPDEPLTEAEQAFLERAAAVYASDGAYAHMHATRPQTLAYALSDSPVGLAAWMVEKFRSWSDCDDDIESVIGLDHLLTNISLHWFSGALGASLRLYKEGAGDPLAFRPGERLSVPLGVAVFPKELPMPPRSWVERVFEVRRWTEMRRGGHFAAMEQPELLAGEIRSLFSSLR